MVKDKVTLPVRAAIQWRKMLLSPTSEGIKQIGSMQRKFSVEDWAEFIHLIWENK